MKTASKIAVITWGLMCAASAWAQPTLFSTLGADRMPSKAAVETQEIAIQSGALQADTAQIAVDLFDGKRHVLTRHSVIDRGEGNMFWQGHFADGGEAVLTVHKGVVVGLLYGPDGLYEIGTAEHGGQILSRIHQEAFPGCATEEHAADQGPRPRFGVDLSAAPAAVDTKAVNMVDIMTVWTPQARNGAGGTTQIEATIQSAVDISNTAFNNSNASVQFHLVHMQEISYNDSGDIQADRNWLRDDPTVNALRDQYGADLVGMIVENSIYCGIAFLMGNEDPAAFAPNGYQVTVRQCAVGNLSFAHEHGHNMGLQHNPENGASQNQATYPWSYGHYVNGSYRTVMSYSNPCSQGCTRQPYFSNPNVVYQGAPTGIAEQRHNQRTLDLISPFTVEYRPSGGTGQPPYALSTAGEKRRGRVEVTLTWTGASTSNVDIYRNGGLITTTANDGNYLDATGERRGTFTYQVCDAGTSTCSNTSTESF